MGKRNGILYVSCILASVLVAVIITEHVPTKVYTHFSHTDAQTVNEDGVQYFKDASIVGAHIPQANSMVDVLRNAGYDCTRLTGASMQPTSFSGNTRCSIPYDHTTNTPTLSEGMKITFINHNNQTVHHRIIALSSDGTFVITQGDNNIKGEKVFVQNITLITLGNIDT